MSIEHADLLCERCDRVTEHELHYAGRLLESVRCTRCGHQLSMTHRALVPAYLHDLEQRVAQQRSGSTTARFATPGASSRPAGRGAAAAGEVRPRVLVAGPGR